MSASAAAVSASPRRIGRDTIIYGLGTVLRRAASLIMLPVYTRLLSPSDYGLLQILDMTLDVVSIMVSAGTTAGVMRFYFKTEDERERRAVIWTATCLLLGLNLIGSVLLAFAAGPVHRHLLDGAGAPYFVMIAAANFTLNELVTVPMLLMQVRERAVLYSATGLARLVSQLSLNILFLVVLRTGPLGILISTMITNVLVGGASLIWMAREAKFSVSRTALHDLRRFAVPYQFATAATFILQFGDRFFLEAYRGLAAVGLYGFAYQFGFMLDQLTAQPFSRAWQPRRFAAAGQPRERREADDNANALSLSLLVVTCALGIALAVRPALRIIAAPAFFPAGDLVPVILAAFVVQAWSGVFQFGIDAAERTRFTPIAMWISAAVILFLYALLIPHFGAMGAAIATLLSFVVRLGVLYAFSRRVWPLRYEWGPHLRLGALAVAAVTVAWLLPAHGFFGLAFAGAGAGAAYLVLVWATVLKDEHKAVVRERAVSLARRARLRPA